MTLTCGTLGCTQRASNASWAAAGSSPQNRLAGRVEDVVQGMLIPNGMASVTRLKCGRRDGPGQDDQPLRDHRVVAGNGQRSMWPPVVVVGAVLGKDGPQVLFAKDQDAVGELGSGRASTEDDHV